MGTKMKLVMFVETAYDNTAFRILNVAHKRERDIRKIYDRYNPVRIYWLWEDENRYGSNFKTVMRRMKKFGIEQSTLHWDK